MLLACTCASSIGNLCIICFGADILIPCLWVDPLGSGDASNTTSSTPEVVGVFEGSKSSS